MEENSTEEVKKMAQEKVDQAKTAAKEKLEQVKNMSADEAKELAKEKAEQAKKLAAEKLEQMKKMSADDAKKMAEEKMEKYKTMPMINKVSYGAAAAILLMLLMSIFTKPSSPEDRAQAVCEALSDGDCEEAVGYVPEEHQKGALGLMLAFGGREKELEKMSNYDCTIKTTNTKGDPMKVYFEGAPIVKMRLHKDDGEYYWRM